MESVEARVVVEVDRWTAFAVSQTTGDVRRRWDNFIARQHHLDGVTDAAKGVRTETVSKHRLTMISEYVSFKPPERVGMRMVRGPWFFERFGGGWSFNEVGPNRTEAVWRYTFRIRPHALGPIAVPIGRRVLQRDIDRRIAGFALGCADPVVLDAARTLVRRLRA